MKFMSYDVTLFGINFNLSPVAFTLPIGKNGWDVYWYGIIIATGFLLAIVYAAFNSKRFGLDNDKILDVVATDASEIERFNAVLKDSKLELNGKNKVKGLQDQLRTFCLFHDLDYDKTDIKSLEDVQIQPKKSDGDSFDEDEDIIDIQVDKEELLLVGLITNGIIIDHETRTIHLAELWLNTGNGYIQGTKQFIEKYMIQQGDKGYKIMYYPHLKDEKPKGQIIPGYCVPFENGSVLIHYYKEMLSRRFGRIVK